jgi:hypothetical protein
MRTRRRLTAAAALFAALLAASSARAIPTETWAVIINADTPKSCSFDKHLRNVEVALESLESVRVDPRHIFVVSEGAERLDSSRRYQWSDATSRAVTDAMAEIGRRIRPDDTLLVYLTGHGQKGLGQSHLVLRRGSVSASELARTVGKLPTRRIILVADQCYSGGFAEKLADTTLDLVAVTSTDADHRVGCVHFIRPFWRALAERNPGSLHDPMGSVRQAYEVAEATYQERLGQIGRAVRPQYVDTLPRPKARIAAR